MEFSHLPIVRALVQDPHLSRVATRFGLTQGALSKRLQNIEGELGIKLFDRRGPRGLQPTAAAREMADLSEQVLTTWNSGLQKLKRHFDEPTHFGIVGPQIFMREIVLPWWNGVAAKYPEMTLEAHISQLSRVSFELVQAGMDAGVLEHKEELADYICKPIFTETWGIVAHPRAKVTLNSQESLTKLAWGTLSSQNNPVDEWLVRRQLMPPPVYRVYWNDLTALVSWVMETPGAATVLPLHACQSGLTDKRVQFHSLGRDSKRILYLAYRRTHSNPKVIKELLEINVG
ncbi:MAG: LysR family transcriptional regulator [Bdellovibrionales bacterium]|nr:LysR family transcriptional regulator [Bdellovibrionales bacterium]